MSVRRVGTWKDALRRLLDAAVAAALPGGGSVASVLARVDGYLYPHEAVFLYWLARSSPGPGCVVEIGSYRGRSTLCLGAGARDHGARRVFAVDPHVYGTREELAQNIGHYEMTDVVQPVALASAEAARSWDDPVSVLFVDGNHERASVEADLEAWTPHLAPGAFVLFHDSTDVSGFPGPRVVARERLRPGDEFEAIGKLGSITWAKRHGDPSTWLPPRYGKRVLDACIRSRKSRRTSEPPR